MGDAVVLLAVKFCTLPLPLAGKPIAILELVQVYVAPAGVLLKLEAGTGVPAQTVELARAFTAGSGFTVMI